MNVQQQVSKFKMDLLRAMPFYGDIVMRLPFEADSQIPTAATNGFHIRYNPRFFASLTEGERNFVLMHEVMHVLLRHAARDKNKDPRFWNVACDLVINQMLIRRLSSSFSSAGIPFEPPKNGLYQSVSSSETAENLYARIAEQNAQLGKNAKCILLTSSWNRSKSSAIPIDADLLEPDPSADTQISQIKLDEMIRTSLARYRSDSGSFFIPPSVYQLTATKRLPWHRLLREYCSEVTSEESSYATPERKYLHMDLILPGHGSSEETLETIWAFLDSSGSIPRHTIEEFLTQLCRIAREFKCSINLCYWDTRVTDVYKNLRTEKELLGSIPRHSGGTNINCVYRWIRENRVKPDVMLIFTDGDFGTLDPEAFIPALRRKTILVLSREHPRKDSMSQIGKVATL